jgi:hypothetical protein
MASLGEHFPKNIVCVQFEAPLFFWGVTKWQNFAPFFFFFKFLNIRKRVLQHVLLGCMNDELLMY